MHSILSLKAYHFDRDDVALQGFHKFMLKQSNEEREHAQKVNQGNSVSCLASRRHFLFMLVLTCLFPLTF